MKNSFIIFISIILMLSSCSKNDDDKPVIFPTISNGIHIFDREFISNSYRANASDPIKINISTTIEVTLNDDDNFGSGVFLVINQNFRYRNSFGFFDPGTLIDTLYISNHTERQFVLNGDIEYINTSYIIEEPEVIVHDRNFTFFRP